MIMAEYRMVREYMCRNDLCSFANYPGSRAMRKRAVIGVWDTAAFQFYQLGRRLRELGKVIRADLFWWMDAGEPR